MFTGNNLQGSDQNYIEIRRKSFGGIKAPKLKHK